MGKVTIKDLAALTGLSQATISLSLRDHPRISVETRRQVQRLAKKHGYAPHPMVSELMAQLPHIRQIARPTLALVTCWPQWRGHIFLKAIHEGVNERAKELGYQVEEFPLHKGDMSPARLEKVLDARGIEGVLVYPFERSPSRLAKASRSRSPRRRHRKRKALPTMMLRFTRNRRSMPTIPPKRRK